MGIDPISGKPKIAEEVLEGMRTYLRVASGPEKVVRVERVRKSLEELENDPIDRRTMLMLEPTPTITTDLDKGKGIVYDFSHQSKSSSKPVKLMASAIAAGTKVLQSGKIISDVPTAKSQSMPLQLSFSHEGSTGFNTGFFETSTSGTPPKKTKARRRPGTFTRKANGKAVMKADNDTGKKVGEGVVSDAKRKAQQDVEPSQSSARFKKPLVVPIEGPSNI